MSEIEWTPGIGDPTVIGWLTVVAYFLATWLCMRAFMVEKAGPARPYLKSIAALLRVVRRHFPRPPAPARRAALWLVLAMTLAMLGVNKQLDLQSLLTDIGRVMAHRDGWYEQRRTVQATFIVLVLLGAAGGMAGLVWLVSGHVADFRLALGGMLFLMVFVLLRASSFHGMDTLIGTSFAGVRVNWVLELSGIGIVGYAAARRLRQAMAPSSA